jgi:hypothetical protein
MDAQCAAFGHGTMQGLVFDTVMVRHSVACLTRRQPVRPAGGHRVNAAGAACMQQPRMSWFEFAGVSRAPCGVAAALMPVLSCEQLLSASGFAWCAHQGVLVLAFYSPACMDMCRPWPACIFVHVSHIQYVHVLLQLLLGACYYQCWPCKDLWPLPFSMS